MDIYGGEVNRLIEELGRLPGIGAKAGILYHQYAGRTSTGTCRFNRKCKEEDSILQ